MAMALARAPPRTFIIYYSIKRYTVSTSTIHCAHAAEQMTRSPAGGAPNANQRWTERFNLERQSAAWNLQLEEGYLKGVAYLSEALKPVFLKTVS